MAIPYAKTLLPTVGIDFSGDHRMWGLRRMASNIWIAEVHELGTRLELHDLRRVQELPGRGSVFERLTGRLRAGAFRAAAIDAPFSIPREFLKRHPHTWLLEKVSRLARSASRRPFPEATRFVSEITGRYPCEPKKPLRQTERLWQEKQINVRSTLWCGPRGGAAMTAACLTLLHAAERPIWPWADPCVSGLLVEAFPAAQLRHWGLPHDLYNGASGRERRHQLVAHLDKRLALPARYRQAMSASADALDAVLCAFAARAVVQAAVACPPTTAADREGWIAVHV
jgi:hypothetical protein